MVGLCVQEHIEHRRNGGDVPVGDAQVCDARQPECALLADGVGEALEQHRQAVRRVLELCRVPSREQRRLGVFGTVVLDQRWRHLVARVRVHLERFAQRAHHWTVAALERQPEHTEHVQTD